MRLSQQNIRLNKLLVPSTFEAVKMYEELGSNLSRNWDPLVMNEEAHEHRLDLSWLISRQEKPFLQILCTVITRH